MHLDQAGFFPLSNPVLKFSLILFIILFTPHIFKRIKVPPIIGLILAGAIIGPHSLNLMMRDSSITLFGTVGLLYIMFIAGLEIDLADFKQNSAKSLGFGLYTFIIPMVLGYTVFKYVLNYSVLSSVLIASLFASHTLVTYPIIAKYGVSKNRAVVMTIGGTMITDILALMVLTIVIAITKGNVDTAFFFQLMINFIFFTVIVIFIFPIIARRYLKQVDDNISQYLFVLALVFLAAFFAELAGMESIIGAFLAGLALNQLIPKNSPLMNRIEFIGNALFIPFFLIGVGMLINFKILISNPYTLLVAFLMIVTASVSKYSAAYLTQKSYNLNKDERLLIFGLSNSRVAATLATVMVGYNTIISITAEGKSLRLLGDTVLDATILMILFTCTIASFATQKSAYNISQSDDQVKEKKPFFSDKILIPLSLPENLEHLIHFGLSLNSAKVKDNLFALNVMMPTESNHNSEKKGRALLDKAATIASGADNRLNELIRYDLNISNAICSIVFEQKISDIVLGLHHKKGLTDSFLGKLIEGLLNRCNTNFFICRFAQPFHTVNRLVAVFPTGSDKELGFHIVLFRLWNFVINNGLKLLVYGDNQVLQKIKDYKTQRYLESEEIEFSDWEDFLIVSSNIRPDDALFIMMSREGNISYNSEMNKVPKYLNKYFLNNNYILIYPKQCGEFCDNEYDITEVFYRDFKPRFNFFRTKKT